MFVVGLLSSDPKLGTFAQQREAMGDVDREWLPEDRSACLNGGIRRGEVLALPHARAIGRTMRQRDLVLADLAERGVLIRLPGREPMTYRTSEDQADFHAVARQATGRPSRKQKALMGRPRKYPKPTDAQMERLRAWWDGPQHTDDVIALTAEMLGKKVRRQTLYEWMGRGRADHPDRVRRKPRKKNTKEDR